VLIWYLARGAGISAYLAFSVALGVGAFIARPSINPSRRVVWQYVHRSAAMSGLVLLSLHISLLLADSYARVGWVGALVPFQSGYRPWQVTLGLLAMYLMVTVAVTGMLRSRFASSAKAVRVWRAIHLSSYVAWVSSAVHFYVSGTDSKTQWALLALIAGIAIVAVGVGCRLSDRTAFATRTAAPARRVKPVRSHSGGQR
jgi:predicted ferric reductase